MFFQQPHELLDRLCWTAEIDSIVSQVIMRVHKPKVEYKLALQEKPQGA